ncbi:MAG: hypothetical protein JJU28_01195 [Cyclobacteriaceae bacterium]|nr:hypothetical protein [Cyclobacteriaceae bacterium]
MKVQFAEMPPEKIIFILVLIVTILILGAFCMQSKALDKGTDLHQYKVHEEARQKHIVSHPKRHRMIK